MAEQKAKENGNLVRLTTYVQPEVHERIKKLSGPKGIADWIAESIRRGLKDGFTVARKTSVEIKN